MPTSLRIMHNFKYNNQPTIWLEVEFKVEKPPANSQAISNALSLNNEINNKIYLIGYLTPKGTIEHGLSGLTKIAFKKMLTEMKKNWSLCRMELWKNEDAIHHSESLSLNNPDILNNNTHVDISKIGMLTHALREKYPSFKLSLADWKYVFFIKKERLMELSLDEIAPKYYLTPTSAETNSDYSNTLRSLGGASSQPISSELKLDDVRSKLVKEYDDAFTLIENLTTEIQSLTDNNSNNTLAEKAKTTEKRRVFSIETPDSEIEAAIQPLFKKVFSLMREWYRLHTTFSLKKDKAKLEKMELFIKQQQVNYGEILDKSISKFIPLNSTLNSKRPASTLLEPQKANKQARVGEAESVTTTTTTRTLDLTKDEEESTTELLDLNEEVNLNKEGEESTIELLDLNEGGEQPSVTLPL